jgi:NitT/TauT family transport system ATP-binding protein
VNTPLPALLRLHDVSRRFNAERLALAHVSMQVLPGDFVSLLGPSGCGKSTVLRLLAGLDQPSGGRIERAAGVDEALGMVFQDAALMPWATAADNVALPLQLRGTPGRAGRDAAVRDALAAVGLADAAGALPRELSGGMRMRVSLARALVQQPRLWLLDEPFGALDEISRFALNQLLLQLCQPAGQPRATAVFVTPSVYEAVFLSSRILVMARPGRIVDEIRIDAPYPRDAAFRNTPGFYALCVQVSEALQRASDAAGGVPA